MSTATVICSVHSAIVLKMPRLPTCFESNQALIAFGSLILWCALVVWQEERLGALEGSPGHIPKKVHTGDQGSGVNEEATPLSQLAGSNTWR